MIGSSVYRKDPSATVRRVDCGEQPCGRDEGGVHGMERQSQSQELCGRTGTVSRPPLRGSWRVAGSRAAHVSGDLEQELPCGVLLHVALPGEGLWASSSSSFF